MNALLPERDITKTTARLVFLHWKWNRQREQICNTVIYIYTDKKYNPVAQVEYFANLRHLCRLLSFWWSGCNLGPYSDRSPALLRLFGLWLSCGRASPREQVWRYAYCCGNILHTVVLHFVAYRENNPLMSRAWASPAMTACDWNYLQVVRPDNRQILMVLKRCHSHAALLVCLAYYELSGRCFLEARQ